MKATLNEVRHIVQETIRKAYQILGVDPTASEEEIKSAYRKLSLQNDPRRAGQEGFIPMSQLNIAYNLVNNANARRKYDLTGSRDLGDFGLSGTASSSPARVRAPSAPTPSVDVDAVAADFPALSDPKMPSARRPKADSGETLYKVYGKKSGAPVHTRYKAKVYLGGEDTKFKNGDRVSVAAEPEGNLKVTDPNSGHTQSWKNESLTRTITKFINEMFNYVPTDV